MVDPREQAIAARLTVLVAAVERLIAADDGSQEKQDAIDALYLNFNYRKIRADLAHVETLTQQVADSEKLSERRRVELVKLGDDFISEVEKRTKAEQQRDAAHAALRSARQFVVNGVELGYITMPDPDCPDSAHQMLPMIDAALAASAPQKEEK